MRIKDKKPKILLFDLETSLLKAGTFSLWNPVNYDNILSDWYIICAAWKWLGEKQVKVSSVLEGRNLTDDKTLLKKLRNDLVKADIIVGHNIRKFDLKKLNTRLIANNLKPIPQIKTIDTYSVAKKEFAFTSNRLDYIAKYLGVGSKIETSKGLWLKALAGDKKAIKEMCTYNKGDVLVNEKVFDKLRPFITDHPNMSLIMDNGVSCKNCGSHDLVKNGFKYNQEGKKQRWACRSCGASNTLTKILKDK